MTNPPHDDWLADAACKGLDPSLFVIDRGTPAAPAKKVCAGCTVRDECNDSAVFYNEIGVWGGRIHKGIVGKQRVITEIQDSRIVNILPPRRSNRNV